jgi:hypothetical protein
VARRKILIKGILEVLRKEGVFLLRPEKQAGIMWTERREDCSKQWEVWQRLDWEHGMFKELKLVQESGIRDLE